jgi:hypothetical protein
MELTNTLAIVMGIVLLAEGLVILTRRKLFVEIMKSLYSNHALMYVLGIIMLISGTFLLMAHNTWEPNLVGLITLLNWMVLIKGLAYMFMPHGLLSFGNRFVKSGSSRLSFLSVLVIVLGAYMLSRGMGWL